MLHLISVVLCCVHSLQWHRCWVGNQLRQLISPVPKQNIIAILAPFRVVNSPTLSPAHSPCDLFSQRLTSLIVVSSQYYFRNIGNDISGIPEVAELVVIFRVDPIVADFLRRTIGTRHSRHTSCRQSEDINLALTDNQLIILF